MQGLRNIKISTQGQLYNKQGTWVLKHDKTWASHIMSWPLLSNLEMRILVTSQDLCVDEINNEIILRKWGIRA